MMKTLGKFRFYLFIGLNSSIWSILDKIHKLFMEDNAVTKIFFVVIVFAEDIRLCFEKESN
jgi:hypothetical protein